MCTVSTPRLFVSRQFVLCVRSGQVQRLIGPRARQTIHTANPEAPQKRSRSRGPRVNLDAIVRAAGQLSLELSGAAAPQPQPAQKATRLMLGPEHPTLRSTLCQAGYDVDSQDRQGSLSAVDPHAVWVGSSVTLFGRERYDDAPYKRDMMPRLRCCPSLEETRRFPIRGGCRRCWKFGQKM